MWWQILGVPSNADLKEIKRAYARLIKEYRPDTHPSEFGDIRQAFEEARCLDKQRTASQVNALKIKEHSLDTSDKMLSNFQQPPECPVYEGRNNDTQALHVSLHENAAASNVIDDVTSDSERLIAMSQLVDEFGDIVYRWRAKKFNDDVLLQQILQHNALNYFESFQDISEKLFLFLVGHIDLAKGLFTTSLNIPYRSLAALDNIFDWSSSEVDILQQHNHENASLVFYGIAEGHKNPTFAQQSWLPLKNYLLFLIRVLGYIIAFVFMATSPVGRIFLVIWVLYIAGKAIVRFVKKNTNKSL